MGSTEYTYGIKKSEEIYNNFFDPYDRASQQIRLLVGTAKDIHDILIESEGLIKLDQRPYPGQSTFNKRLAETDSFVQRYCTLREPSPSDTGSIYRPGRVLDRVRYAADDRKAKKIHEALMGELQKFIQFILVLAMRSNATPPGLHSISGLSGRLNPEDSTVGDIARRLSEIRYQVERRQVQASQASQGSQPNHRIGHHEEPNFADLEERLRTEWSLLCLRAGFEDRGGQNPSLPSDTRQLLLSSGQVYNELIINHTRNTFLTPRNTNMSLTPIASPAIDSIDSYRNRFPSVGSLESPVITFGASPPASPDPGGDRRILGDPALPIRVAHLEIKKKQYLKFQHWQVTDSVPSGRVITWQGSNSANILIHTLSQESVPYTTHSSLNDQLSVTFHGQSTIRWLKDNKQMLSEHREDVKYKFVQAVDLKRFQEDFRDKHLIDTFDTDKIKANKKGWGYVTNQDLKIWCSRDDQTYTISFFADHLREHLEFPLEWFDPDIVTNNKERTVQLTFLKGAGTMEAMLRAPAFRRRFSSSSAPVEGLTADNLAVAAGSMSNSPRPSVSTVNSNFSALGPSPSRVQRLAKQAESFQFLKIEFTRDEYDGGEDSYTRFVNKINPRMRSRNLSRTWTIAEGDT